MQRGQRSVRPLQRDTEHLKAIFVLRRTVSATIIDENTLLLMQLLSAWLLQQA